MLNTSLQEKGHEELLPVTKGNRQYEVIIVGGGPAGIATSLTLSSCGISNCLIEANASPKRKCGEAIPPNAKPIFRQLGIDDFLEASQHQKYYGNLSSWGAQMLQGKDFIQDVNGYGYLLDRLFFEQQLWSSSQNSGADCYFGYRLLKANLGITGVEVEIEQSSQKRSLEGKFVVDATGRKASVCRQLGIVKRNLDPQFALVAEVKVSKKIPSQIMVEATENGWWYLAPLGRETFSIMFFTLKSGLPKHGDRLEFLKTEFFKTNHLSPILPLDGLAEENLQVMPAGTSCLDIPYGENWLAVGDAAYSYDPISSYGITSALAAGFYAGKALACKFSGDEDALSVYRYIVEKAFHTYLEKLVHQYAVEQRWPQSEFWKSKC